MRGEPGSGLRYAALMILTGMSVFSQRHPSGKIPRRIGCNSCMWKVPFRSKCSIGAARDVHLCCWPVLEIPPDDFAPKLTDICHVYGITRRGYGASSHPESGFSAERLGQYVMAVLDALHLTAPVFAGHSLGGHELTAIAFAHPSRIASLVYMDSSTAVLRTA
jgi:pimeloyl-ACP methyl ester carboxylesterase